MAIALRKLGLLSEETHQRLQPGAANLRWVGVINHLSPPNLPLFLLLSFLPPSPSFLPYSLPPFPTFLYFLLPLPFLSFSPTLPFLFLCSFIVHVPYTLLCLYILSSLSTSIQLPKHSLPPPLFFPSFSPLPERPASYANLSDGYFPARPHV